MDALFSINRAPGRLWTVLQFPLTRFLLGVIAIVVWVGLLQVGGKLAGVAPGSAVGALLGLVIAAGIPLVYLGYVRLIERRPAVEIADPKALMHFARGALVGAALFCSVMLLLKLLGAWRYLGLAPLGVLVFPFVGALLAAVLEETLVRGLLFRILEESLGSWFALAISAVIFGLLHTLNPGASVVSTTAAPGLRVGLEAGVLLAAAYMYARTLWLPIGLHFAWNFTEGGVFAASVSGGKVAGVIGVQFSGSDLLTGGAFGPEASLPAVIICLAAGAGFIMAARRGGRVVAPVWRRKK